MFFAVLSNGIVSQAAAQGSSQPTATQAPSSAPKSPIIKITLPTKGEQVPIGKDLTILGKVTGSANAASHCQVSVIVNKIRPYQPATATGPSGSADYSTWKFVLTSKYTTIKPGANRITARYMCDNNNSNPSPMSSSGSAAVRTFSSVNVTGVTGAPSATPASSSRSASAPSSSSSSPSVANNNASSSSPSPSTINNPTTIIPTPVPTQNKSPTAIAPRATLSSAPKQPLTTGAITSNNNNNNNNPLPASPSTLSLVPSTRGLSVSTDLSKDYLSRGDTQFITITVSNSTSNERIAGADISANVHNANGLVKTNYTGTTDSSGKASFSLEIGPRAIPGLYAIEVNATADGYDPKSDTRVFEVNR